MIDWTINLGNILTVGSVIFLATGFYWRQLYDSKQFKQDITDIKVDLKVLNRVVTDLALQNQRLDSQAVRLDNLDLRIEELRHGKGFIK